MDTEKKAWAREMSKAPRLCLGTRLADTALGQATSLTAHSHLQKVLMSSKKEAGKDRQQEETKDFFTMLLKTLVQMNFDAGQNSLLYITVSFGNGASAFLSSLQARIHEE